MAESARVPSVFFIAAFSSGRYSTHAVNTTRWLTAGFMLGQHLRQRANITTAVGQRIYRENIMTLPNVVQRHRHGMGSG